MASSIDRFLSDDPQLAARQRNWVRSIEPLVLVCRARMRHDFPELDPSSPDIPQGVRAALQGDGSYEIISICRRCGRKRREITAPGGGWDFSAPPMKYTDPEGYAAPRGLGLRGNAAYKAEHGDMRAATFADAQKLRAKLDKAPQAARDAAAAGRPVTVKFTTPGGDDRAEG